MRRSLPVTLVTALATTVPLALVGLPAQAADGFAPQPHVLLDANPGDTASDPDHFTRVGDQLFFIASDPDHGNEPWVSDGTAAGTHLVADLAPGTDSSYIDQLTAFRGKLYFVYGTVESQLWVSDGTEAGTRVLLDTYPDGSDRVGFLARAGGALWFSAVTDPGSGATGDEPWTSDGTAAGTHQVADIALGAESSGPRYFSAVGDVVVFAAADADGQELWRTNGTAAGTQQVLDIEQPGTSSPSPLTGTTAFFPTGDGSVYFSAFSSGAGTELWRTDGTTAGTALVHDVPDASGTPGWPARLGRLTYFAATDAAGKELWRTDGTDAGTVQVADVNPDFSGNVEGLTVLDGFVYFRATGPSATFQLWRSDGTEAGTTLVDEIKPGGDVSMSLPVTVGDRLWFEADDGVVGSELWSSDGTEAGTDVAADIWSGPVGGCCGTPPTAVGNTVAFAAETESLGAEPWLLSAIASRTSATPADSYSAKQARKRAIRVPVRVTGAQDLTGTVRLLKGGTVVGKASLTGGKASVRIAKRLPVGETRLKAAYSGSFDAARSTSKAFVVRVRG
ncbi:ELWxxDGT repeat protein [Nocardioides taihuensis]|uniref:ELWxxDGT repeat protein n=1 Tax=Nocardioides taihuensis TaxID=1835606 RepID=A0ABW0BRT4_9ACTN